MKVYRVSDKDASWRVFRLVSWSSVVLLLGLWFISVYEPMDDLGDPVMHALGWTAVAILTSSVILAMVMSARAGARKLKGTFYFELSDDKIVQHREGVDAIEIPLSNIESLHEYRGWLLLRSSNPASQMTIPLELDGYEELRHELAAHGTITRAKVNPLSFLPLVLMLVGLVFLFTSHKSAVLLLSGGAVLLLQAIGFYPIWRVSKHSTRPKLLRVLLAWLWLTTAWVVYWRIKGQI